MEKCGYMTCDTRIEWCDHVTWDCGSCAVVCDNVRAGGEMEKFCWGSCKTYMLHLNQSSVLTTTSILTTTTATIQPIRPSLSTITDLLTLALLLVLLVLVIAVLLMLKRSARPSYRRRFGVDHADLKGFDAEAPPLYQRESEAFNACASPRQPYLPLQTAFNQNAQDPQEKHSAM